MTLQKQQDESETRHNVKRLELVIHDIQTARAQLDRREANARLLLRYEYLKLIETEE